MYSNFIRTTAILGEDAMHKLNSAHVAVFGVGGVGSYTLEALVRSGVGNIDVYDNDCVAVSNINRQIIAMSDNIGQKKTAAAVARAKKINPQVNITGYDIFYLPEMADKIDLSKYDYIVDAIDTVAAKLELIVRGKALGVPVISVMGTGNKLDPTRLKVDDIYATKGCPLARVMRSELRKRGISAQRVVWSEEQPIKPNDLAETDNLGRKSPGSAVFVPATAGLIAASEVVRDIIK